MVEFFKNNMKQLVILALFSVAFSQPGIGFSGYLREVETSICMDECGQYYIDNIVDFDPVAVIFPDTFDNIDLYVNRYVEAGIGQIVTCTECSAYEIESIVLSDDCISPVLCIVDPCEVAPECQINTPTECVANYCDGCWADFYDLNGNLVNCNLPVEDCEDLAGINFGPCAMVLGIGYVNGECSYVSGCGLQVDGVDYTYAIFDSMDECNEQCNTTVSCDDIEENYLVLHSGEYAECEYDIDCIPVWGHCDVSLGGCHYAVNALNYPEEEINEQVDLWLENDCMAAVCDCMDLPYAVCNDDSCELAYCSEPNPAGCFETGCPEGYACIDDSNYCTASTCECDEASDSWWCTEDCGGGTCYPLGDIIFGDINNDGLVNVLDIVLIVSFILMTDEPTDTEFSAGDVNLDEQLNVLDVVAIVQMILNPTELPEDCYIEPEVGPCEGLCPTYYFNQTTNECEEFMTGCCGVEAFSTMGACQNACE